MDGIHDLGGMAGFGPVPVDDEQTFHAPWEERTHGVALFAMGPSDLPAGLFRHYIEQMEPGAYLTTPYYGRWLHAIERIVVDAGLVDRAELVARGRQLTTGEPDPGGHPDPERTMVGRSSGRGDRREADSPARFRVGDRVRTDPNGATGHTRLAQYIRGRVGTIDRNQGSWLFPDTASRGLGDQPTWVYAVRFEAADLWDEVESGSDAVYIDVFEPHLTEAS